MSNQATLMQLYLTCQTLMSQHNITGIGEMAAQASTDLARNLPDGYSIFPDVQMAYKLYPETRTWDEGRRYCIRDGAHLAVIDSFDKVRYVSALKRRGVQQDIYVGIHRLFNDIDWVEMRTGLPPTMIPWNPHPLLNNPARKCIAIDYGGNGVFAANCGSTGYFACEIPL